MLRRLASLRHMEGGSRASANSAAASRARYDCESPCSSETSRSHTHYENPGFLAPTFIILVRDDTSSPESVEELLRCLRSACSRAAPSPQGDSTHSSITCTQENVSLPREKLRKVSHLVAESLSLLRQSGRALEASEICLSKGEEVVRHISQFLH
jgi:hypothetical protein